MKFGLVFWQGNWIESIGYVGEYKEKKKRLEFGVQI